jgi:nicotinate phosphoribosyltransferase
VSIGFGLCRDVQSTLEMSPPDPAPQDRELLVPLVAAGEVVGQAGFGGVEAARARHREVLAELPPYALQLSRGYPAIPTVFEPDDGEP